MSELHKYLENATNHFRDCFLESWLFTSGELERQGFTFIRESSGSGLRGSVEEGEFYGASDITLRRNDGSDYCWTVGMLYESGESWEQGGGYSYVTVCPNDSNMFTPLYTVGNADFPNPRLGKLYTNCYLTEQDWLDFCKDVIKLSEKCLADMEFIFRNDLTSKLYELSLQHPDSSQSNPFLNENQPQTLRPSDS